VSAAPYASLNLGFGGGDERARVALNRQRFAQALGFAPECLVTLRQVHGQRVVVLGEDDDPAAVRGSEADALITQRPETPLGVITADCYPVVLLAPQVPAVGIVHAGRRGTAQRVVAAAALQMRARFGVVAETLYAIIGPGIGGCCYEVDEASAAPFAAEGGVCRSSRPGHCYVDLRRAITRQLLAVGVPGHHMWSADLCTACHPRWFYSYRRDGPRSGRMLNVVMIRSR
jgi:YfiH family protein